jgi:hypothetical protein
MILRLITVTIVVAPGEAAMIAKEIDTVLADRFPHRSFVVSVEEVQL